MFLSLSLKICFTSGWCMRCVIQPVPLSLAIALAKIIASNLLIFETNFKPCWQWLGWYRVRRVLQKMLFEKSIHGLIAALDSIYNIFAEYDTETFTIWTKLTCFFFQLARYSLLMPTEDISTTRVNKKTKRSVSSYCVCQCCENVGACACIKDHQWHVTYFNQVKVWWTLKLAESDSTTLQFGKMLKSFYRLWLLKKNWHMTMMMTFYPSRFRIRLDYNVVFK